ncbi:hypothetical protein, partial [Actinoplanes campanulatus]|uniref:hypothetical protein n=1 Tax=Actinoplanes campanulatus TaxID=113559 RepID=UPI001E4F0BED
PHGHQTMIKKLHEYGGASRTVSEGITDPDDPIHCLGGGWEQDLSWLDGFDITESVRWSETGSHLCADVTYRGVITELELSFWVKPAASGWVVAGPATLW